MKRRLFLSFIPVLIAACKKQDGADRYAFGEAKQRYPIKGEVLRLKPGERIAVVKHEKIEGWMEAMTMDFPVPDEAQFGKLREGMKFTATVEVNDLHYWLTAINPE